MQNVFLETLEKIIVLLEQENKTQKELCDYIGINGNVFTAWKSGKNKSYTKHLPKIAEFFDVSIDYLLGKTEERATKISTIHDNHGVIGDTHAPVTINNGMPLGEFEKEILNICSKLGIKEKNALLNKAYELLENR